MIMYMEDCTNCMPLSGPELEGADNFCFDGSFYYFLLQEKFQVVKTDMEFKAVGSIDISRQYRCICFDWIAGCFWAVSCLERDRIYKLDYNMREIGIITLNESPEPGTHPSGISFDCCNDHILLSYENTVVKVDKITGAIEVYLTFESGMITGVLSLYPGCLIAAEGNGREYIYAANGHFPAVEIYSQEDHGAIGNLVLRAANQECGAIVLDALFLMDGRVPCIKEVVVSMSELNFQPQECNFSEHENSCRCRCPYPPISCYSIFESIALEEAALAHILNAEGEKIQKTVKIAEDIKGMLCVNQAVNETIINVTGLEHQLYSKLLLAYKMCELWEQNPHWCEMPQPGCMPCCPPCEPCCSPCEPCCPPCEPCCPPCEPCCPPCEPCCPPCPPCPPAPHCEEKPTKIKVVDCCKGELYFDSESKNHCNDNVSNNQCGLPKDNINFLKPFC